MDSVSAIDMATTMMLTVDLWAGSIRRTIAAVTVSTIGIGPQ